MILLLDADVIKGVLVMLLVMFAYPIYGTIAAFVFQKKVKLRRSGIEIGHPDTIPNIINYVSRNTKDIYNKIKGQIGDMKFSALTNATDKLEKLHQLGALRDKQVITEDEFLTLKQEIMGVTAGENQASVPPVNADIARTQAPKRAFRLRDWSELRFNDENTE
jgi:hypothetical protein